MKKYATYIIVTLLIGGLSGFLTRNGITEYAVMLKPQLSPPGWLFPVVWTILYVLMGFGAARYDIVQNKISKIYVAQLIVNFLWSFIFFENKAYLFAFLWLILLLVLVILMTIQFYRTDKLAGLLQIPYVLWLIFAGYLNFSVYLLNM